MNRRTSIYIGIGVLIAALAGGGIYVVFSVSHPQGTQANAFASAVTSASGAPTTPSIPFVASTPGITAQTPAAPGTKRYFNKAYHFTLEYPGNLQVSTFPGDSSSIVVAFKDPATGEGFQVFAVPYDEPKITQQTFQMDEPSGVMDNPQNITVDGAPATGFYSEDQAMGDTFEVWFLNGGVLYEVTTYRSLDSWLINMLGSWKFV